MVDLIPDDDDRQLVDAASSFLSQSLSTGTLRAMAAEHRPLDRAFLRRCGELGWFGLTLSEELGGSGLSVAQEALVFRELGRRLAPGPFLATALAARVAAAAGERSLARRLAAGEQLAALAETGGDGRWIVWPTEEAELVVLADLGAKRVWLVDPAAVKASDPVGSIDPLTPIAFSSEQPDAVPLAVAPDGAAIIDHAAILCAAMLTGIAEQTRDASAEYAKVRVQFGRPIGSFQAVKHRCADMAMRAEAAWAQTAVGALSLAQAGSAPFEVAAAKVITTDSAVRNARDNIQNHGGIGFTAEHEAHLFVKRAHVLGETLGSVRHHLGTALEAPVSW